MAGIGVCVAAGAMACGPHRDPGGFASASTTPRALPLGVFPASAIMTQKYGIVEWRFFSGRSQRVVTGYRADGSAARGVQLAWFPKTSQSEGHLRMLMLDGSGAAVRRMSSGNVTGSITPLQAEVLVYSVYDAVHYAKTQPGGAVQGESADPGGRFHALDVPQNGQSCGNQLSGAWTNGVSCAEGIVSAPATVIWGLIENLPGEIQGNLGGLDQKLTDSIDTPCLGFFNNYANSLSACAPAGCVINPGGPMVCGFDSGASNGDAGASSNDDAAQNDDSAQVASNDDAAGGDDGGSAGDDGGSAGDDGGSAGDDGGSAGDDGGDPGGDDGGTEVASGDDGGDPGADPNGDDGGASNSDDPPTDQEIQTASSDSSCLSCEGSASDLSVDPANGDVTAAGSDPNGGNAGNASATSDTSDPPGGGSGSGGGGDNGSSSGASSSSSSGGGQASEDQASQDQPSQDQGTQDQGTQDQQPSQDQGSQDQQPSQDQGSQDQGSQDASQDELAAHRHRRHGHKPSGWRRLYDRVRSWLSE
jgi:hypothetical protein